MEITAVLNAHGFAPWHEMGGLAARGGATLLLVAAALVLLRRGGQVVAGLVAAVPVTSAPALAWVGLDRGAVFAAQASLAALYATGLTAVYAAAYGLMARRTDRLVALLAAGLVTVAACAATHSIATHPGEVVAFVLACFAAAAFTLPRIDAAPARTSARRRDIAFTACVSGVLAVLVTLVAQRLPAQWCGLIAAIPVVGMTTIALVHGRWPLVSLRVFLRSYVHGLVAKACFAGTLAAALVPFGLLFGWIAALAAASAAIAARQAVAGGWLPARRMFPVRVSTPASGSST